MTEKLVTMADLEAFGIRLLERVSVLFDKKLALPKERWIKSHDVRRLLMISPNTLNAYRLNGTLPYTRVGSIYYYDAEDIIRLLNEKKKAVMNDNIQRRQEELRITQLENKIGQTW